MIELDRARFGDVRPFFLGHRQYSPALAALEGTLPGRVFADSAENPRVAIVWALTWWAYVEGRADSVTDLAGQLSAFLREVAMPGARELGMNWFELYVPNEGSWMEESEQMFGALGASEAPGLKTDRHFETTYVLDRETFRAALPALDAPAGVTVEYVDVPLLPTRARGASSIPDEFKPMTAPAYRLVVDERVAALCKGYGFASDGSFMLAVDTYSEDDRGKGYATAVCAALIEHAIERGLEPLWETTEWNEPSQKVAAKLGYVPDESYPVYAVVWDPEQT